MMYARFFSAILAAAFFLSTTRQIPESGQGKQITVDELRNLLGKKHLDTAFKTIRERLVEAPKAEYSEEFGFFHHIWLGKGVAMRFVGDELNCIFLYNEGVDRYKAWTGELPWKLKLQDSAMTVQAKIGKPAEIISEDGGVLIYKYSDKGMSIRFSSRNQDDAQGTIAVIRIYAPVLGKKKFR